MSIYTTGEIAKLCEVSVRTVQFYDTKNLLNPSELTEGGRRLYSDGDLKKLRLICLLKALGLSLDSIKGIIESEEPNKILLPLLHEQTLQIETEIADREKQIRAIEAIKENLSSRSAIPIESISDIEQMMNDKKKLKKTHGTMLFFGIIADLIEIGAIIYWVKTGNWVPFAIGMAVVVVICILLTRMYYKNTVYICPECHEKFKPRLREFFFSKHTPKTRKLTCTACGFDGYCIETAS